MTDKNKENLLNIYDDKDSDDLFSTDIESKEKDINKLSLDSEDTNFNLPELDIKDSDKINNDTILNSEETIKSENKELDNSEETTKSEDWLDNWFMDELNELKDDWEKKSLFWNIFKRKKKKENILEETIKPENKKENIDIKDSDKTSNIFDDFNQDDSLLEEVNQIKQDRDRDIFYYLGKAWKILQILFVLLLLLFAIVYLYIYIQNKVFVGEDKDNQQILWPFCFVLLNWVNYDWNSCTSISTLKVDYTKKLVDIKEKQKNEILSIIKKLYEIENFTKTNNVIFLRDETKWKLNVLKIIEDFDNLKNNFSKVDKQTIQCKWIKIDKKDKILSMRCSAYSAWYESWIRGFDGKDEQGSSLKWTSISIANSFLNYISLESKKFTIIDRQRLFKSDSVLWSKTGFTNKTDFTLKLKYNLN